MEVYAVTREFAEWGKGFYNRLPAAVRNGLRAAGVCHYLVVVRQPEDGRLWMFDFGPVGGDVTGMMAGGVRPDVSRTPMDAVKLDATLGVGSGTLAIRLRASGVRRPRRSS